MAGAATHQHDKRETLRARIGYWTAELVLVFVGVSAAFWLNNYQQRQQEAKRRDQILASLEETLRQGIASGKISAAKEEQQAAAFQRALDAGEMPPLHPYIFTTDYSPADFATLLQAGGIELLDVDTLMALRNDESIIRWGIEPAGALSKIKRRTHRAESRPGHFLLLRSRDQEIATTFRDLF